MNTAPMQNHKSTSDRSISIGQLDNREAIATQMEALAIELRSYSNTEMQAVPSYTTLLALAKKLYSVRRKVDEIFGMPGFSVSPAWDIMLDLYQAEAGNTSISVTSASIGAACPPTTALRWLQALESMMLIERSHDPHDKRRVVVSLTEGAIAKIEKALQIHL